MDLKSNKNWPINPQWLSIEKDASTKDLHPNYQGLFKPDTLRGFIADASDNRQISNPLSLFQIIPKDFQYEDPNERIEKVQTNDRYIRDVLDGREIIRIDPDHLYENNSAELDDILIAQFRNEAKRFNPDFIPNIVPDLNSPEAMAAIQDFGPFYCFKSKAVILAEYFNPDSAESKNAASMKEYFQKYIEAHPTMDDVMMVDLYSSGELRAVAHTIGLLATGFLLSELDDVSAMTDEFEKKALDPEAASLVILSLIYFTLLVNSIIGTDIINKIFICSWDNFYSLFRKRVEWLCEYGTKWKNEFSGALFFD